MKKTVLLLMATMVALAAVAGRAYSKRQVMIEMRDGVKLYTQIFAPKVTPQGGSPVILVRSPYSIAPYQDDSVTYAEDFWLDSIYANRGYIIVMQNVRGTYLSEGQFVQVRPYVPNKQAGQTDDASDTYDTIEWLISHLATNGRVGIKGTSYLGFYATVGSLCGHPALKAVSPQAPVSDWWAGDDIHHNGAFMLEDIYDFGQSFFRTRPAPTTKSQRPIAPVDTFSQVFFARPLSQVLAGLDTVPFWNDIINHPDQDDYWLQRDPTQHLVHVKPAMMVVGGLYDAEDCYGAWHTWRQLKRLSPTTDVYLVEGPWYHGAWSDPEYQNLDGAWFGKGSAQYFYSQIEYPFFAYYLEGKGQKPAPVTLLPSGQTAKKAMKDVPCDGMWQRLPQWPPASMRQVTLKLGHSTVTSDPLHPVPYMARQEQSRSRDKAYMAADQRFASKRADVLTFDLGQVRDTLRLMGPVSAKLELNTTGSDLDVIVKLIDVRPDGYQMLVRGDVMPARYRQGTSRSVPVEPGKPFEVGMTMPDVAHVMLPGHRLMVQVQFTCYPLVAVCPQTFVPNRYKAQAADYQSAQVTLQGGTISLPVVK